MPWLLVSVSPTDSTQIALMGGYIFKSFTRTTASALAVLAFSIAAASGASATNGDTPPSDEVARAVADFEQYLASDKASQEDRVTYDALTEDEKAELGAFLTSDDPLSSPELVLEPTEMAKRSALPRVASAASTAPYAARTIYNVTSTYRVDMKFLGLSIGHWINTYRYQTNAADVTGSLSCSGVFSGFSGATSVTSSSEHYLASKQGFCITTFKGSLFYKGSNISSNKELGMIVDGKGVKSGWLKNL